MKKVGIWIDKKVAKIVTTQGGQESLVTLLSEIEDFHPSGGSGTRVKGGPQDVVQDSKYLEREKHQLAEFFNRVTTMIKDAESIVIFGPAQTGEKLKRSLIEKTPSHKSIPIKLKKADNMTDNQIIAWVKNFYQE